MTTSDIKYIEKNKRFKKDLFSRLVWSKYALFPPALVLFSALFCIVYLFNSDLLISIYCIPFLLLLLAATIWFKTTRKQLIKIETEKTDPFLLCLTIYLFNHKGVDYYIFFNNENRQNKYLLEKTKNEIIENKDICSKEIEYIKNGGFITLTNFNNVCITKNLKWNNISFFRKKEISDKYVLNYSTDKIKSVSNNTLYKYSN